ncbi:unnamed protein product, partial [Ectocarpus sp. 12 AP-2014]
NQALYREQARAEVAEQLGTVRAALESTVVSNIQLVRGLVAVIATDPDIDQAKFERIVSELIGEHSQLRSIAAAPDLVISMIYPMIGNEQALGLDYLRHPTQREAALASMQARHMVLAGPVDLVQGGRGFIGRFPVFVEGGPAGNRAWGLVSAVIDVEQLYVDSGLTRDDLPIQLALMGRDADLSDDTVFFGEANILGQGPVITEVSLPNGGWRIAAIPRDGWRETPSNALQFRAVLALVMLIVM